MFPAVSRRALAAAAVIALLGVMEAEMLLSVRQESQTCDEAYNLFAGYVQLTAHDFSVCPAYPPLTKAVAALPLLHFRPHVPPMTPAESADFQGGRIFLYANRADQMLFAARVVMTVFPLLLAVLIFLATREMFGTAPAFIALGLIVFEPNLLAHGPLAINDVALACWLFAAAYAFWRYVAKPSLWRLAIAGLAGGLTLACKVSGLILFPILILLAFVDLLAAPSANEGSSNPSRGQPAPRLFLALLTVAAVSLTVLWGFYDFRYSPSPNSSAISLAPLLNGVQSHAKAAAIALAAHGHLLPEAYLGGLAYFFGTDTRATYLLGTRYAHGVWFYFPTVMLIKCTLGFLFLLALAPFGLLRKRECRREVLWMLIPASVYLAASVTSNLDIGVRHILPIYPFLSVLAAAGGWALAKRSRAWGFIVAGLVLIHAASSLRAFPNYISYSNELWGGPSKTYRVLTDSNVDWGQGLVAAKRYIAAHPDTPCWMAYFGSVDPAHFELPCKLLTTTTTVIWERPLDEIPPVIDGTVLVSATEMSGQIWGPGELNPYDQFRTAPPVACLAGSILVYEGKFQVPLASALSRIWKVVALANHGQVDAALDEARGAALLAPHSVDVQFVLARALRAAGQAEESHQAFENALHLAQTIHPEAQTFWIPVIKAELSRP